MRWLLVIVCLVGCALDDEDPSDTFSVTRSDSAPEGVTINDVDHVRDGIIDIHDLVAVAHFWGQEVAAPEAQACPAGSYREYLYRVVGYDEQATRHLGETIFTDRTGRRLEGRHNESCAYLYPQSQQELPAGEVASGGTTPSDCLLSCDNNGRSSGSASNGYQWYLCEGRGFYGECRPCQDFSAHVPLKKYVTSDDPTTCKTADVEHVFKTSPRLNGGDPYHVYALLKMQQGLTNPTFHQVAIRFFVWHYRDDEGEVTDNVVSEIKLVSVDSSLFSEPLTISLRGQSALVRGLDRSMTTSDELEVRDNVVRTFKIANANTLAKRQNKRMGIQLGISDQYGRGVDGVIGLVKITIPDQDPLYWRAGELVTLSGVSESDSENGIENIDLYEESEYLRIPSAEVREKYFPEDR